MLFLYILFDLFLFFFDLVLFFFDLIIFFFGIYILLVLLNLIILLSFLVDFLSVKFEFLVNISGMMHFFRPEVSSEKSGLQLIAKLYFFVLDHGTLVFGALKIFESFDCTVVFASIFFLPLNSDPNLVRLFCALVHQRTNISNDTWTVVEEYSTGDQLLPCFLLRVVFF